MQRNFLWTPANGLGTKWPRKCPRRSHKASDSHTTQPGLTEPPHQVQKQQKEMDESKYTADHQRCGGQGSAAPDQAKCPSGAQTGFKGLQVPSLCQDN